MCVVGGFRLLGRPIQSSDFLFIVNKFDRKHFLLRMAEYLASIFGTEKDK